MWKTFCRRSVKYCAIRPPLISYVYYRIRIYYITNARDRERGISIKNPL